MPDERKRETIFDTKTFLIMCGLVAAFVSPFIAIGGFKEKIFVLEKRADAAESKVREHELWANEKNTTITSQFAAMNQKLSDQGDKLNKIDATLDKLWGAVRKAN